MIKNLLLFIISCLSVVIFSACGSSTPPVTESSSTPVTSNKDTLKLLYWQAPTILNPHLSTGFKDAEASRIALEPLASHGVDGELIPFLAEEIPSKEKGTVGEDGKSVTWQLKKDIKWSDGEPFTAKDVVFTYEFIKNPKAGSTSLNYYQQIDQVEATDDHTVKVTFKQPTPAWDSPFVGGQGMILPYHIYKDYTGEKARQAPANLKPVGTGPYRVVDFKPGDIVVYEANPNYRNAADLAFAKVELKGGGDAVSAARAVLQTQEADFAYNLQVESSILEEIQKAGKGQVLATPGALIERILLNQTDPNKATSEGEKSSLKHPHPFLTDKKVRQAITLATDRETISKQLYGVTGEATPNFLVLPKTYLSPNNVIEYNLEKAKKLLDEAGWKDTNGNGTRDKNGQEMQIIFQTSANLLRQKTQEIVKQGLQSIGIGVELKSIDASVFFSSAPENIETIEHFYADLQMVTTGNNSPQPDAYFKTYTCQSIPQKANNWSGENYSRYCNPQYDKLWQQATIELKPEKRQKLLIALNDLLIKDYIVIPLIHRSDVVGVSQRLLGVEVSPWERNTWKIAEWKLEKK